MDASKCSAVCRQNSHSSFELRTGIIGEFWKRMEKVFTLEFSQHLQVPDGVQEGSCRRGLRWLGRAPALVETSWVLKTAWCSFNRRLMRGWLLWQRQERGMCFYVCGTD